MRLCTGVLWLMNSCSWGGTWAVGRTSMLIIIVIQVVQAVAMSKIDRSNRFLVDTQNNRRLETSVRMLEFINMYNLRSHEILYQCPLLKADPMQEPAGYDLEVQCLEEMADVGIIYDRQRREELSRLREIERENEMKSKEPEKLVSSIFRMFMGGSRKKEQVQSVDRPRIDSAALSSSKYMAKSVEKPKDRPMQAGKNDGDKKVQQVPPGGHPVAAPQSQPPHKNPFASFLESLVPPAPPLEPPASSPRSQNPFGELLEDPNVVDQLPDDIGSALNTIREESVAETSKVSHDRHQHNEADHVQEDEPPRRLSSYRKRSESEEEAEGKAMDEHRDAMKKKYSNRVEQARVDVTPPSKKNSSQKMRAKKSSQQSPTKDAQCNTQHHNPEMDPNAQDRHSNPQQQTQPVRQDSYSDVVIDRFIRIQACDLREQLLLNRIQGRWHNHREVLHKIKEQKLGDFKKQLRSNSNLQWKMSNFNFARVLS